MSVAARGWGSSVGAVWSGGDDGMLRCSRESVKEKSSSPARPLATTGGEREGGCGSGFSSEEHELAVCVCTLPSCMPSSGVALHVRSLDQSRPEWLGSSVARARLHVHVHVLWCVDVIVDAPTGKVIIHAYTLYIIILAPTVHVYRAVLISISSTLAIGVHDCLVKDEACTAQCTTSLRKSIGKKKVGYMYSPLVPAQCLWSAPQLGKLK